MAMLDYGALTWKDGVLISETEFFDDMQEMVGWTDKDKEPKEEYGNFYNNWFTYIGDEELTIAFYKYCMRIHAPNDKWYNDTIYFGSENFEGWRKWEQIFIIGDHWAKLTIKKAKFGTYYIAKLRYKGNKWRVTFGSGVCYDTYTKYHIMSAWNMPVHRWHNFKFSLSQFLKYDLKFYIHNPSYVLRKFSISWRLHKYD